MKRNYQRVLSGKYKVLRKGLKQVHIGDDVWLIGKVSKKNGRKHQVIYGPGRKEYHLWDKDVDFVNNQDKPYYDDYGNLIVVANVNRHGNTAFNEKVKIYILTHILDDKSNWCFNLTNTPDKGKLKVIYDNGTVKNIDFDREFSSITLNRSFLNSKGEKVMYCSPVTIKPVAYRI